MKILFTLKMDLLVLYIGLQHICRSQIPPNYLDNLLETKSFDEFARIMYIPNVDLVDSSQRKLDSNHLLYNNGLTLGDILLRPGQLLNPDQLKYFYGMLNITVPKWPNGKIPYYISKLYPANETEIVKKTLAYNNKAFEPNVEFVPHKKGDIDYLMIFKGGAGCYSNMGRVGGPQVTCMDSPCLSQAKLSHELQHTIGMGHQANRVDRENYVKLLPQNIPELMKQQFIRYTHENAVNFYLPFDYASILGYPLIIPGFTTQGYEVVQPNVSSKSTIGQEPGLSEGDKQRVKLFYS